MPEQGTRPVNKYLPPRERTVLPTPARTKDDGPPLTGFWKWLDGALEKLP